MREALLTDTDAGVRERGSWRDYVALTKPRIVFMIVLTTIAGFYLGLPTHFDLLALLHTIVGTTLIAAGSNALNQYTEREHDKKMNRTVYRPLPDGRVSERNAFVFGVAISALGIAYLALAVHWLPAALALLTWFTYLFIYTPMKRVSPWCTEVGAFPGALPPLIGWAAASHTLTLEALLIFGILFFWQLPHFMAIGWMYKEDYTRAGYQMVAVRDTDGRRSAAQAIFYAVVLLVVSVLPYLYGFTGVLYVVFAALAGLLTLFLAIRFFQSRTRAQARTLFLSSNLYLPLIMLLLVFDRT